MDEDGSGADTTVPTTDARAPTTHAGTPQTRARMPTTDDGTDGGAGWLPVAGSDDWLPFVEGRDRYGTYVEDLPPDVLARRAELVAEVGDNARRARAAATWHAYGRDWADFEAWCAGPALAALPAAPLTVAGYEHLAAHLATSVEAITAGLEHQGGFPARLSPAGQADFTLGYYNERAELKGLTPSSNLVTEVSAQLARTEPRERLELLALLGPVLDAATKATVAELRAQNVPWKKIGAQFGMSRQAAYDKFGLTTGDA